MIADNRRTKAGAMWGGEGENGQKGAPPPLQVNSSLSRLSGTKMGEKKELLMKRAAGKACP